MSSPKLHSLYLELSVGKLWLGGFYKKEDPLQYLLNTGKELAQKQFGKLYYKKNGKEVKVTFLFAGDTEGYFKLPKKDARKIVNWWTSEIKFLMQNGGRYPVFPNYVKETNEKVEKWRNEEMSKPTKEDLR